MKKLFVYLLGAAFFSGFAVPAVAQLTIEITEGVDQALPIAVVPFEWQGGLVRPPLNVSAIIAADLATGRPVIFKKGELAVPIRASCAYPGLFLPVENDGCQLVDGGLVRTVPTLSARDMGADVVLGVALGNMNPDFQPRHIAEVLARSFSIAMQAAEPIWRRHADLVVEPKVDTFAWDDFARTPELVEAGYAATQIVLPELKKLLGEKAAILSPSA